MYQLTQVQAGEGLTLHLTYDDGATVHADLSGLMSGDPGVFSPLAERVFFDRVGIVNRGRGVGWPGELDLDADTLRLADSDPDKPQALRILSSTPGTAPDPVSLSLREAVVSSGLTQTEVAERAGIQQPNLARLLDPNYHGHSLSSVRQVAGVLGLEVEVRLLKQH